MFGRRLGDVAAIEPHREDIQRKYFDILDSHKQTVIVIERSGVQFSLLSIEIFFHIFLPRSNGSPVNSIRPSGEISQDPSRCPGGQE